MDVKKITEEILDGADIRKALSESEEDARVSAYKDQLKKVAAAISSKKDFYFGPDLESDELAEYSIYLYDKDNDEWVVAHDVTGDGVFAEDDRVDKLTVDFVAKDSFDSSGGFEKYISGDEGHKSAFGFVDKKTRREILEG